MQVRPVGLTSTMSDPASTPHLAAIDPGFTPATFFLLGFTKPRARQSSFLTCVSITHKSTGTRCVSQCRVNRNACVCDVSGHQI